MRHRTQGIQRCGAAVAACAVSGILASVSAAQVPASDIFIVAVSGSGGTLRVTDPKNITRRIGYDNQPWFAPGGGAVFFTSGDTSGMDIFRYERAADTTVQLTHTEESEYSPTIVPGGGSMSVVRVELDGAQHLWRYSTAGEPLEMLIPAVDSVGYHAWIDERRVALFVVGEPHSLRLADIVTGVESLVFLDIDASLGVVPGTRTVQFVGRVDDAWWFHRLDPDSRRVRATVPLVEGGRFCAWTADGDILMGADSTIYVLDETMVPPWRAITDLATAGISGVSRMMMSPDGRVLAVVASDATDGAAD